MAIVQYDGHLNANKVMDTIFNMIISQQVFAKNVEVDHSLVARFRVDGTMYGDTKLYYSTDAHSLWKFIRNGSRVNGKTILTDLPPNDPKVQAITIDTFWQTGITIDETLLKQAFGSSDVYGQFCNVVVQWLRTTKEVLDLKLINTFVGTVTGEANKSVISISLPERPVTSDVVTSNQFYKLIAGIVGEAMAKTFVELEDVTRDYNDYKFLRNYKASDFILVWNPTFQALIEHLSKPYIFHDEKALNESMTYILNHVYFGDILTASGKADGTTTRTLVPVTLNEGDWDNEVQLFPGDLLPESYEYGEYEAYTEHSDYGEGTVICKLIHKDAIPFMSAMMVETEFHNAMSLTRNHYVTWGHNTIEALHEFPIVSFVAHIVEADETVEP